MCVCVLISMLPLPRHRSFSILSSMGYISSLELSYNFFCLVRYFPLNPIHKSLSPSLLSSEDKMADLLAIADKQIEAFV